MDQITGYSSRHSAQVWEGSWVAKQNSNASLNRSLVLNTFVCKQLLCLKEVFSAEGLLVTHNWTDQKWNPMTHLIFDMTVPSCVALPGATEMTTTHTFFGEFQVFAKPHPVCTWPRVRFAAKPKPSQVRFTNSAGKAECTFHLPFAK